MARTMMAAALALMSGAANAADEQYDFTQPRDVVRALQAAGYKAEFKTASDGAPYVSSATNGNPFTLYFDDCDTLNLSCKSIEFYGWWKKQPYYDLALANRWNAGYRYLKVAIDKDGDLEQRLDISTIGMTMEIFKEAIRRYESTDSDFNAFLEDEKKKVAPAAKK